MKKGNKRRKNNDNKGDMVTAEYTKNLIIIVLVTIVVLLIILCISAVLKSKYTLDYDGYNKYPEVDNNVPNINDNQNNNNNENTNKYITKSDALKIALDSLKISRNDVYDLSNELDYKYGTNVYEVEFKYNRYEYEFYIDATNGKIIKSFKERD